MPTGGLGGFYFDPMYLLFIGPALLLAFFAQSRVQGAFAKYSQIRNSRNMTGNDVARVLLPAEKLDNVSVETVPGKLSDHYDPQHNILRFSPDIAQQPSIAAMAVAAHEIGHAEQDRDGYLWMKIRSGIVPVVQIGSQFGYLVFFGGLLAQIPAIAWIGILMFSAGAIFSIVTLPVEFDASSRALRMLNDNQIVTSREEYAAAKDMLNAAALTYVAGAAQAVLTIAYYIFVLLGSSRRRDSNY
jgi:hypothetical protein